LFHRSLGTPFIISNRLRRCPEGLNYRARASRFSNAFEDCEAFVLAGAAAFFCTRCQLPKAVSHRDHAGTGLASQVGQSRRYGFDSFAGSSCNYKAIGEILTVKLATGIVKHSQDGIGSRHGLPLSDTSRNHTAIGGGQRLVGGSPMFLAYLPNPSFASHAKPLDFNSEIGRGIFGAQDCLIKSTDGRVVFESHEDTLQLSVELQRGWLQNPQVVDVACGNSGLNPITPYIQ
jgi:hypothetical protein